MKVIVVKITTTEQEDFYPHGEILDNKPDAVIGLPGRHPHRHTTETAATCARESRFHDVVTFSGRIVGLPQENEQLPLLYE